jgi:hypothetical protein
MSRILYIEKKKRGSKFELAASPFCFSFIRILKLEHDMK